MEVKVAYGRIEVPTAHRLAEAVTAHGQAKVPAVLDWWKLWLSMSLWVFDCP